MSVIKGCIRWPDQWEMICGGRRTKLSRINADPVLQPRDARLPHMRKLLKPFVFWLLLIAVPFQGYAAATMMCCGSAHSKGVGHSAQKSSMQGSMHSHLSVIDHDEGTVAAGLTSVADSDSGAHHHDGDSHKRIAFKCGACASCCVSAAIVQTSDHSFDVASLTSARISFLSRYFYRFVPETLERPPFRLIA